MRRITAVRSQFMRDFNPRIPYGMRLPVNPIISAQRVFQSTHPVWDATLECELFPGLVPGISIHASRMGCDLWDFYFLDRVIAEFQSTHPVWDATLGPLVVAGAAAIISIHASRMGCDSRKKSTPAHVSQYFNPRIPYGMRQMRQCLPASPHAISIHASRMGCVD